MISFLKAFSRSLNAHRTARHLGELPDHVLKDIGLTRGQIPFIERERRYTDK